MKLLGVSHFQIHAAKKGCIVRERAACHLSQQNVKRLQFKNCPVTEEVPLNKQNIWSKTGG